MVWRQTSVLRRPCATQRRRSMFISLTRSPAWRSIAFGRLGTIADIGAGAGFPGLALAIALPDSEVRLVESQSRKCAVHRRAAAAAGVENARVVQRRIEEWSEGLGDNDVVVARALAPQPVVLEYAAPLLEIGGVLVDWRGRRNVDEETDAAVRGRAVGSASSGDPPYRAVRGRAGSPSVRVREGCRDPVAFSKASGGGP